MSEAKRTPWPLVTAAVIAAAAIVIGLVLWSMNRVDGQAGPGTPSARPTVSETESAPTGLPPSTSPTSRTQAPTGDADAPVRTVAVDPQAPIVERPELPYLLDTVLHRGPTTRTFPVEPTFE